MEQMEQQYMEVTKVAYTSEDNTTVDATINGKPWSGITAGSRFWPSVAKAIEDGLVPTPWAAPPPPTYEALRMAAYPPVGDQLDAIWKQLNYDRLQGHEMIQDVDDVLGDILSVKNDIPKD